MFDTCFYTCYHKKGGSYVKDYSSREVIAILKKDGWYEDSCLGSHHHFKHPTKPGKITVPAPKKGYPRKTLLSIFKQAQININDLD